MLAKATAPIGPHRPAAPRSRGSASASIGYVDTSTRRVETSAGEPSNKLEGAFYLWQWFAFLAH